MAALQPLRTVHWVFVCSPPMWIQVLVFLTLYFILCNNPSHCPDWPGLSQ